MVSRRTYREHDGQDSCAEVHHIPLVVGAGKPPRSTDKQIKDEDEGRRPEIPLAVGAGKPPRSDIDPTNHESKDERIDTP